MLLICYNKLRLNKVCHIRIIIYSSWNKSSTCHCMSPSWNYHYLYFLSIKHLCFLFNVALYYWNCPKGINILKFEILCNFIVPQIPFIEKLFSKLIWIIPSRWILKLNCGLPLLTACNIRMIAIIEALGFQ